ncbi:hypothetical protein BDZ88DRAFT_305010 [Geranomyces variabilis]|nr:hypothetical protein BDZ88DRAFT_305010 [Geranomyces variabilis]
MLLCAGCAPSFVDGESRIRPTTGGKSRRFKNRDIRQLRREVTFPLVVERRGTEIATNKPFEIWIMRQRPFLMERMPPAHNKHLKQQLKLPSYLHTRCQRQLPTSVYSSSLQRCSSPPCPSLQLQLKLTPHSHASAALRHRSQRPRRQLRHPRPRPRRHQSSTSFPRQAPQQTVVAATCCTNAMMVSAKVTRATRNAACRCRRSRSSPYLDRTLCCVVTGSPRRLSLLAGMPRSRTLTPLKAGWLSSMAGS